MSKTLSLAWFKNRLVSGLFALLPLVLTLMILRYALNLIVSQMEPIILSLGQWFLPLAWLPFWNAHRDLMVLPLSLVTGIMVLLVIGVFAEKGLKTFFDTLFRRVPFYSSIKQVLDVVDTHGSEDSGMFSRACLLRLSPEVEVFGFVTALLTDDHGGQSLSVYVPMPPNPTSGIIYVVKADVVRRLDWSTEQTMKMAVSGGLLAPEGLRFKDFQWSELRSKNL